MEAKLKDKNYDFVFIDLFSRTYEDEMLTMLRNYCDVSSVVMFTTKENHLLNYFNYKYGIKHYIFSDDDMEDIIDEIKSLLSGTNGSNGRCGSSVLTSRECEILKHIADGKTSKEIADELCISKNTVDTHRNKMLQKLNLANSASLVHYAFKSGMV
ncbi:MAG: response regulator transcription factor [Deferribacterales bacterium]|jgi:DNA-binding NarL/FixJ family response regulator